MVKASELRVGNYLNFLYKSGEHTTKKMLPVTLHHILQIDERPDASDFFEPIHLTPEILKAAGFDNYGGSWNKAIFYPIYNNGYFSISPDPKMKVVMIEHLHQLQNLYHALTGDELTVNMEKKFDPDIEADLVKGTIDIKN